MLVPGAVLLGHHPLPLPAMARGPTSSSTAYRRIRWSIRRL